MSISFGFGSGSSKNSYTGSDTYDKTTTPVNPDWVNFGGQSIWNGASQLGAQDPQSYVAGSNPLLDQTQYQAQNGLTGTPWYYDAAAGATARQVRKDAPTTSGVTANGYVDSYLNPYLDQVVGATKADMDAQAGQTRAQQSLDLARSGAFGGSGAAITQSQTEGQLSRALGTTLGGLRSQGFDTATQNAQQDAQRQQGANDLNAQLVNQQRDRDLAAAGQLSNIATQQSDTQRQNLAAQMAVGNNQRTVQQQQQQAPLDLQSWLGSQFSGLPLNLYQGQNETGTELQSGTSKGKTSSFNFGFGSK